MNARLCRLDGDGVEGIQRRDMGTESIFNWDYLAQSVPGFGELEYLRSVLGEEFPFRAARVQPPSSNPILVSLLFPLTGAVGGLKDWSIGLRALSGTSGLNEVLADLDRAHPTKPSHAFYLIEVAGKLRRQGFTVSFEPSPPDPLTLKRPDALLKCPGTSEKFYFEASVQGLSAIQSEGFYLLGLLLPANAFPDVRCAGRWVGSPTHAQLDNIERRIEVGVEAAKINRTFVEISEIGILEMAACHRDELPKLDVWRAKRGLSGSCFAQGLRDNTDEISRLKNKIQTKQKQVPEGFANVLLIQPNSIFNRAPVKTLISELQKPIRQRGHLGAVVIRGGNLGDASPFGFESGAAKFERRVKEGRFDHTLIMWNPHATVRRSASFRAALLRAFFD